MFWGQVAQCTQTGVRTTTTYRQDFPYIGLPLETAVKTAGMDGKLLRSATNTWRLQGYEASWDARGSGSARLGPLQPYLETSVEKVYDLPATANDTETELTTVTTATEVDGVRQPHAHYGDDGRPRQQQALPAGDGEPVRLGERPVGEAIRPLAAHGSDAQAGRGERRRV